mmetsp:Transcript_125933/g.188004  ORF Transcript_125933/g.188004 Transcript_125933/m.188004 type:complete len:295 (-) Transcript_125933:657-1541(-)
MAVSIVLADILRTLSKVLADEFCHTRRHTLRNIRNDPSRLISQLGVHAVALVEILKQSLFVGLADSIHGPGRIGQRRLVKAEKMADFDLLRRKGRCVVFNSIQGAEDEVEDQNVDQHGGRQLTDDGRETSGNLDKNLVAKCQIVGVKGIFDVGRIQIRLEGFNVHEVNCCKDLVDVRKLFDDWFFVRFDLSVGALLFACISLCVVFKQRSSLAKSTQVFLGRVKFVNVDKITMNIGSHRRIQVLPPRVQQPLFANETKPGRKQQLLVGHHIGQTFTGDPFVSINFIRVGLDRKL